MLDVNRINKNVPIPLYFQLKTLLLDAIKNGEYGIDEMIPTEKELSEMFGISRTTVRQAITEMVQEGWLYRIASKGTFVARLQVKQDFIKRVESFNDQIRRSGCTPSTVVIEMKRTEMPSIARVRFNLSENADYLYIHRVRFADDTPIVRVETYLPYDRCAFVKDHDLNNETLYSVLDEDRSVSITRCNRVLEAVEADADDVKYLRMQRGKPVQLATTIGYNRTNEPIEFSIAHYRGDRNRFEVELLAEPLKP